MNPDEKPEEKPENGSGNSPLYPGYGKRHDIFYQYEAPEQATMPAQPQPPAVEEELDLGADDSEYVPESGGHKKLFIFAAIFLTIIVAGAGFLIFGRKKTQPPASNNGNSASSSSPDQVSTACYTFTLPKPHGAITASSSCGGTYQSNNNDIVVTPYIYPFTTLDSAVSSWKSTNPKNIVSSQATDTFGQYQAEDITWSPQDSPSETHRSILTLIPTNPAGSGYTDQGAQITLIEIDGRYDSQSSSKSVYDSLLSTWVWK